MIDLVSAAAQAAATAYSVPIDNLYGESRDALHSGPRLVAMYLAREVFDVPPQLVAQHFDRDRSTVYNAVASVEARCKTSRWFRLVVRRAQTTLEQLDVCEQTVEEAP